MLVVDPFLPASWVTTDIIQTCTNLRKTSQQHPSRSHANNGHRPKVLGNLGCCLVTSSVMSCVDWYASQFLPTRRRSSISDFFPASVADCLPVTGPQQPHAGNSPTQSVTEYRLPPTTSAASHCRTIAPSSSPASNWSLSPHHAGYVVLAHGLPLSILPHSASSSCLSRDALLGVCDQCGTQGLETTGTAT